MKFSLFGTKISVSFLFLSLITFIMFIDKSGYIIPMSIAVILHEIAHLVCMSILGCQPKEIRLIPGGIEITRTFYLKKQKEILISASGPFINILLFLLFLNLHLEFALINLCIGVFNLLPLTTLDGGEIFKIILSYKIGEDKAKNILGILNLFLGISGVFFGVLLFLNKTPNISLILFSLYLILSVIIKL